MAAKFWHFPEQYNEATILAASFAMIQIYAFEIGSELPAGV